jgi:hypothetical protein
MLPKAALKMWTYDLIGSPPGERDHHATGDQREHDCADRRGRRQPARSRDAGLQA